MQEVDPRFHKHKARAARRRRRAGLTRLGWPLLVLAVLGGLGAGLWLTRAQWSFGPVEIAEEDLAEDLVAFEDEAAQTSAAFAAAFIDIPGDPLLIRLETADTARTTRKLTPPEGFAPARATAELLLVEDVMVSSEERFITTLPSSQEDFAFFQAQKTGGGAVVPERADVAEAVLADVEDGDTPTTETPATDTDPPDATPDPDLALGDDAGGWGETLDNRTEALPGFEKTRIENTTSIAFVRDEQRRRPAYDDIFVRISARRDVAGLLTDNGFDAEEAATVATSAKDILALETLEPGHVVALRGRPGADGKRRFVQMSVYGADTYHGTLGVSDAGDLGLATDPWVADELFDYTGTEQEEVTAGQKYRMLDAFYSTAIRNRVPAIVVGEAISLLSKAHDLDAFANPGDRMVLLYAPERGEAASGAAQLYYIGLKGASVDVDCFVFAGGDDYACFGAKPGQGGSGGGTVGGMVTPVKGVLTSRFGPRTHPVLKTVRVHKGVDWAAPTGTPIHAAFDGRVSYAGDGRGYGNLVKLTHANGFETRYAHMSRFGTQTGAQVRAGDVIGYVGTTGLSTGPHLHFEMYLDGQAIDPFAAAAPPAQGDPGAAAVEVLVAQIIKVESAGNAHAKNPLSTATGLGQFIESTWIRMMRTYRPDLVAQLGRAELLALRTDPTISREMVKNLAREGESYLRARGHAITAGRLYLCHFLGAEGAHLVLSSPDEAPLINVLGAGVIRANPFLRGKTVAYVKQWAEKKMTGRGQTAIAAAPPVVREPAGLADFRQQVRALIGQG